MEENLYFCIQNPHTSHILMKLKILITGSSGFLGSRLALHYRDKYELLLPSHAELNVSREEAVRTYLEEHRPDVVVHCAALSSTWYCEQHPEESHRVNVQGTVRIAKACKLIGAKFIFMSSDQVYNGTPLIGPLREDVVLQPVNVYGRHKLEAEQRALWNLPAAVGLRLTWMYDLPPRLTNHDNRSSVLVTLRSSKNIMVNLKQAYDAGTTLCAATHEFRGVTNVWDVVRNMEKTFALPGGVYNFGSTYTPTVMPGMPTSPLNSHTLFCEVARLMGFDAPDTWILPDDECFAEQPRNLTMDLSLIERHGIHFADILRGIAEAINHPYRY